MRGCGGERLRARRVVVAAMVAIGVSVLGAEGVQADPPADALAPPNFLDYPAWGATKPSVGASVSVVVPGTVGAAPVSTSCQWQDGERCK